MPVEQHESKIDIRRGKYDSLDIYEITEDELSTLKLGSPNSVLFNIAISSLSISVTLGVTLLTVTIEEDRSFYVFVIALFVALFSCIITAILWLVSDNNFKEELRLKGLSRAKEFTWLKCAKKTLEIIENI